MISDKAKKVLRYTWPIYAFSLVGVSLAWKLTYDYLERPSETETLSIFVSGTVKDLKSLKSDLLEEYSSKGVLAVDITSMSTAESLYLEKLTVAGYHTCDILLIPQRIATDIKCEFFALEIDEYLMTNYFSNRNIFSQEGHSYGLELDKSKVEQYLTLDNETYYVFINSSSKNTGNYYEPGNDENINAFYLASSWSKIS